MVSEYETKDISEAAALILWKQSLKDVQKRGSVSWFIFDGRKNCLKLSKEYYFGDLKVNARQYSQELKRLKILIFH